MRYNHYALATDPQVRIGLFALAFAVWVVSDPQAASSAPARPTAHRQGRRRREHEGADLQAQGSQAGRPDRLREPLHLPVGPVALRGGAHHRPAGPGAISTSGPTRRRFSENQSQIDLRGAVVITTSDGLKVETDTATYTQSDEVTRAPGPVRFSRARMLGSSVGAALRPPARRAVDARSGAHHGRPGRQGRAAPTSPPAQRATPSATVTCASSAASRSFAGRSSSRRTGRWSPGKPPPTSSTRSSCAPSARLGGRPGAIGLESMYARHRPRHTDDGQTLQQATLVGEAVVRVAAAPTPGAAARQPAVDVELAADGQSVQGTPAQDDVQLDLPAASPGARRRSGSLVSLDATASPGVPGLRTARFAGEVEFREAVPATKDNPAIVSASCVRRRSRQAAVGPRHHRSRHVHRRASR